MMLLALIFVAVVVKLLWHIVFIAFFPIPGRIWVAIAISARHVDGYLRLGKGIILGLYNEPHDLRIPEHAAEKEEGHTNAHNACDENRIGATLAHRGIRTG